MSARRIIALVVVALVAAAAWVFGYVAGQLSAEREAADRG